MVIVLPAGRCGHGCAVWYCVVEDGGGRPVAGAALAQAGAANGGVIRHRTGLCTGLCCSLCCSLCSSLCSGSEPPAATCRAVPPPAALWDTPGLQPGRSTYTRRGASAPPATLAQTPGVPAASRVPQRGTAIEALHFTDAANGEPGPSGAACSRVLLAQQQHARARGAGRPWFPVRCVREVQRLDRRAALRDPRCDTAHARRLRQRGQQRRQFLVAGVGAAPGLQARRVRSPGRRREAGGDSVAVRQLGSRCRGCCRGCSRGCSRGRCRGRCGGG